MLGVLIDEMRVLTATAFLHWQALNVEHIVLGLVAKLHPIKYFDTKVDV